MMRWPGDVLSGGKKSTKREKVSRMTENAPICRSAGIISTEARQRQSKNVGALGVLPAIGFSSERPSSNTNTTDRCLFIGTSVLTTNLVLIASLLNKLPNKLSMSASVFAASSGAKFDFISCAISLQKLSPPFSASCNRNQSLGVKFSSTLIRI
jgi:hypothetical protein